MTNKTYIHYFAIYNNIIYSKLLAFVNELLSGPKIYTFSCAYILLYRAWSKRFAIWCEIIITGWCAIYQCKDIPFTNISCTYMSHAYWHVAEKLVENWISIVWHTVLEKRQGLVEKLGTLVGRNQGTHLGTGVNFGPFLCIHSLGYMCEL